MPSYYDHDQHHYSRPGLDRGSSNGYSCIDPNLSKSLTYARYRGVNEKTPRAYDPYHEPDVRHQYMYPRTVGKPPPLYQPSYQLRRSWPPSPTVEDEWLALAREYQPLFSDTNSEEAHSRGTIDQLPIILDVTLPLSRDHAGASERLSGSDTESSCESSESSEPRTPEDSGHRNQDQRYVYIPKEGIEIPLTYDEAREPQYARKSIAHKQKEQVRGRAERPRVETGFDSHNSLQANQTPRERAPSPYAFVPQHKPKGTPIAGEQLLSPEALTPNVSFHQGLRREPSRSPQPPIATVGGEHAHEYPPRPVRPSLARPASAAAYPGDSMTPTSASGKHNSYGHPTEKSDDNHHKPTRDHDWSSRGRDSPESPRKVSLPIHRDRTPRPGPTPGSGLRAASPPPRARSSVDVRPTPPQLMHPSLGLQAANFLLQNPHNVGRRASPRASPAGSPVNSPTRSPYASPPRTPPFERKHSEDTSTHTRHGIISQTPSSPLTPLQSPQTPRTPGFLFSDSEHERLSRRYAPKSRRTSPLPSLAPTNGHGPQIDIRSPSPAHHQKSFSNGTEETKQHLYDGSRHLSLAPFDTQPSALKPPTLGQRRRASSTADTRPQLTNNLVPIDVDKASRSPSRSRRPTMPGRAVSVGAVPTGLPPCPRPNPVSGFDDWYTLAEGPRAFSICPSCRDAVSNAGFERHVKAKSTRTADLERVRCDFSRPWMRMAWDSTVSKRRRDTDLLLAMADIVTHEKPCPGNVEAVRDWYRLTDPETGKSVHDFQVCPQCVLSLETIHPTLRDVFHKSHGHHHRAERTCSLRTDSKRFRIYLDLLSEIAKQAEEYRRPPNMFRFLGTAHRIAGIPECSRDDMLLDQEWFIIPHLPEFTVCEDCYEEVVFPARKQDVPVATDFKKHPKAVAPSHVGVSCQLYSPRMRQLFKEACQRNDMQMLKSAAVQRYRVEKDLQARIAEVQKWPREERVVEVARLVEEWKRWE